MDGTTLTSKQGKVTIEVLELQTQIRTSFVYAGPITTFIQEQQAQGRRYLGMEYIGGHQLLIAFEDEEDAADA